MTRKTDIFNESFQIMEKKGLSSRSIRAYTDWIYKFLTYHDELPVHKLDEHQIEEFLHFLSDECQVAPSSHDQALHAILFLFRHILHIRINHGRFKHAVTSQPPPLILSKAEIRKTLYFLKGENWLMTSLLYGCGLRVSECIKLKINDIDLVKGEISVEHQKRKRSLQLPQMLLKPLQIWILTLKAKYENYRIAEEIEVTVPPLKPTLPENNEWGTYYLFPSLDTFDQLKTSQIKHRSASYLQQALKKAFQEAKVSAEASAKTLRHSFAVHLLQGGCDVKKVQRALGHSNVRTTMMYLSFVNNENVRVKSPMDYL